MIKIIWRSKYDQLVEMASEFDMMREDRDGLLKELRMERNRRIKTGLICDNLYDENVALKKQNAELTRDNHEVEQIIKERDRLKKSIADALKYLELNRGGRTSKNTLKAKQLLYFAVNNRQS